jgi:tetratricopeptide (TPR) repeat protein
VQNNTQTDTKAVREALDRGNVARRAGRSDEALAAYRDALAMAPENAEANSLCGLMLMHQGSAAEAEPLLRKAVEREPHQIAFRMNMVELLERQGRLAGAIALMETVIADAPSFSRALERMSDLCLQAQLAQDAFNYLGRALALEPRNHQIALKRAALALDLRRFDDAQALLRHVATLVPGNEDLLRLSARLFEIQGDWNGLARSAALWAKLRPSELGAWRALATASYEIGDYSQASQAHRRVMDISGRSAAHLAVYAQCCVNSSEFSEAEEAVEAAEALDPDHLETLSVKALLLTFQGRFDEAEACCRRALHLDPGHVQTYKVLSSLKRGKLSDSELDAVRRLSERTDIPEEHRITAAYALGDGLDAREQFDAAFAAYDLANRIGVERAGRERLTYNAAAKAAQVDTIISQFSSRSSLRPSAVAPTGPRPIFIVGMPRSGTTLVESVLAPHSRVLALGERVQMPKLLTAYLSQRGEISDQRWLDWARTYWEGIKNLGNADHITDKNPFNFEAAGLIALMFPTARVVHVRRNPVETGLSVFRNEFTKFVHFASGLESIGHFYGQYARLTEHWQRTLGDRFITVQYEDFAGDLSQSAPALVRACGLEWEDGCLRRDSGKRPIATLSSVQVRQPVSLSVNRADRYKRHLSPLMSALEATGVDLKTGAVKYI